MTTFRLATLAAAAAIAFSLPARAEVVNAPTASGVQGGSAVLSFSFDLPVGFDLQGVTLNINWPAPTVLLDPTASTALGLSWTSFQTLFEPEPLTKFSFDPVNGHLGLSGFLTDAKTLSAGSYTVGLSFLLPQVGQHTVTYSLDLIDVNADVRTSLTGSGQLNVTAAVPEPASLALLLAGLGVVGCAARRRTTTS